MCRRCAAASISRSSGRPAKFDLRLTPRPHRHGYDGTTSSPSARHADTTGCAHANTTTRVFRNCWNTHSDCSVFATAGDSYASRLLSTSTSFSPTHVVSTRRYLWLFYASQRPPPTTDRNARGSADRLRRTTLSTTKSLRRFSGTTSTPQITQPRPLFPLKRPGCSLQGTMDGESFIALAGRLFTEKPSACVFSGTDTS